MLSVNTVAYNTPTPDRVILVHFQKGLDKYIRFLKNALSGGMKYVFYSCQKIRIQLLNNVRFTGKEAKTLEDIKFFGLSTNPIGFYNNLWRCEEWH